ncbi:HAD family hydrolase [Nonomuraea sp. LPB2021202275-12-8]|uniref:HAD family hydrolase n=1 Tax=Nonomuraea sp. LPB2021202275-12-8 TaxID=3120159 RepID=UPI00300D66D7
MIVDKLALFDLDNTLVDRLDAFRRWVAEFADQRRLGEQDAAWMVELDADGSLPMDEFFAAVRKRFGLPAPAEVLLTAFRARMPELVVCPPEVLAGLGRLREAGWRIGLVTNGQVDNQTGKIARRPSPHGPRRNRGRRVHGRLQRHGRDPHGRLAGAGSPSAGRAWAPRWCSAPLSDRPSSRPT